VYFPQGFNGRNVTKESTNTHYGHKILRILFTYYSKIYYRSVIQKMEEKNLRIVTCTAPVNIAVIKYCKLPINYFFINSKCSQLNFLGGKRDEKLILPINDSISLTLSSKQVTTSLLPSESIGAVQTKFLCVSIRILIPKDTFVSFYAVVCSVQTCCL
jgi:hypothetical protein